MFPFKRASWIPAALAFMVAMLGCARYGTVVYDPAAGTKSIESLMEDFEQYRVYYSGLGVNNLSGVLFDPKNDAKALNPTDRWGRIEDRETLEEAVTWLKTSHGDPAHSPRVMRLLGPEGDFYGYLYSIYNEVKLVKGDGDSMVVYSLPLPPHYREPAPGGERIP